MSVTLRYSLACMNASYHDSAFQFSKSGDTPYERCFISPSAQSPIEKAILLPRPAQGGTLIQCHEFKGFEKIRRIPTPCLNVKSGVEAKYGRQIRRSISEGQTGKSDEV